MISGPMRVLIVDDDPDVRDLVRLHLEADGYEVFEAKDGSECLRAAREGPRPDMILLDLMMPRVDGWQCLTELKADPDLKDIPVVVVTARTDRADQVRALTWAADYVTKPFQMESLLRTIAQTLDHRR